VPILSTLAALLALAAADPPGVAWSPFVWWGDSLGEAPAERAVLAVPVRLRGAAGTCWMQLDTGCNITTVYGTPFAQLGCRARPVPGQEDLVLLGGAVGGCAFDSLPVFVRRGFGDSLRATGPQPLIGTVGQDLLAGRVLVMDFPDRRFCLTATPDSALRALLARASFTALEPHDGKLFVPLRVAGVPYRGFFLDTGASRFAVVATRATWRKLTGLEGSEPGTLRLRVPSWGREAVLVGAPVNGNLALGTLEVARPVAWFDSSGAVDLSAGALPADGLLGNALFYDEYVMIIDRVENRFGLLRRPPGGPPPRP